MSYCFVRITNYYPQLLNYLYSQDPSLINRTYSEQQDALVRSSCEIAGSYVKNLIKLGIKSHIIVTNASYLQKAWRIENGVSGNISHEDLIIEQLKKIRPDVVWIDDFSFFNKDWKTELLRNVPTVKLFMGHICAPYNPELEKKFKLVDIMLTCTPCFKEQLEKTGLRTYLLYHGFNENILDFLKDGSSFTEADLLFTGSLYPGGNFHNTRIEYIEKIIKSGINISVYGNIDSWEKIALKKVVRKTIRAIKQMGAKNMIEKIHILRKYKNYAESPVKHYSRTLIKIIKPPVFGMDMYRILSKAKVVLNIHGDVAGNCAGNIRLFEATGIGRCLITDWKENFSELFELEKEVVTYKSVEECIDKIKWLLKNPSEREKIAAAGQRKTLTEHTIEKRAKQVNEIILNELNLCSKN